MKFSLISSAIIGSSMVLAAPIAQQNEVVVSEQVVQVTSIIPVTTVVNLASSQTQTPSPGSGNIQANAAEDLGSFIDDNPEVLRNNTGSSGSGSVSNSEIVNGENYFALGASNTVNGPGNPNQIGGSPGNAGSFLGSGTNDFGTSVYDYSGYPGGFDQQPGQSEDGSYGPDSGPAEGSIDILVGTEDEPGTPGQNNPQPPASQSQFFRLVANVTSDEDPFGINGYYLSTYHVSAGSSIAQLEKHYPNGTLPSSVNGNGINGGNLGQERVFYTNGTVFETANRQGTTSTSGGRDPFPESIVLTDGLSTTNVASSARGNIYINAGEGTKGVQIELNDNGVYVLSGAGDAGYYSCFNDNVPYNATQTLIYLVEGEEVPEDCTSIVLIPECADGDGNPFTSGTANEAQQNPTGCYIDVLGIDWSNYPASFNTSNSTSTTSFSSLSPSSSSSSSSSNSNLA